MARSGSAVSSTDEYDVARDQLCALVGSLAALADGEDETMECVMMDQDIGGRRYLLVRLPSSARNAPSLSPRELEIVRLIAEGHPNKVIAAVLDISAWTVSTHVRRVFGKLSVTSRAAMVARVAELARRPDEILRGSRSRGLFVPQTKEPGNASLGPSPFERGSDRLAHGYRDLRGTDGAVRTARRSVG
jgi:two-component system, NarL family, nitrate/nitrite response regulator NarL